jgi:hypothetical protein
MMKFRHFAVPIALGAPLVLGFAGCASQDLDEPLATESRPIEGDTRDDVAAGATLIKQGHEPLLYEAPSDGTIWVYNQSDKRLVYTGGIRAGQSVHVDPDHDFVLVDGKKVVDMKMDDFDNHQILFSASAPAAQTPQPASVTVQPDAVKIEQQPSEVRIKGNEVQVQPSGVKVTPAN